MALSAAPVAVSAVRVAALGRLIHVIGVSFAAADCEGTCLPGKTSLGGFFFQRDSTLEDTTIDVVAKSVESYIAYEFRPESEKVFQPNENHCEANLAREVTVRCDAIIGDVAVMKRANDKGKCQRNKKYLASDFKVQKGTIRGTDGTTTTAYKLFPPATRASKFATHATVLYFRATPDFSGGNISVYKFVENNRNIDSNFELVWQFPADVGKFNSTQLNFDKMEDGGEIFVFQTQTPHHEHFHSVGNGVGMADLSFDGAGPFQLQATVFELAEGKPWVESRDLRNHGPSRMHGGRWKNFFPVSSDATTSEGVVWQDQSTHKVYLTWINPKEENGLAPSQETLVMDDTPGEMLVAAASNARLSRIALVKCVIREGDYDKNVPAEIRMVVINASTGKPLKSAALDASKDGLSAAKCGKVGGTLVWEPVSNKLLLIIGRQILGGHQGARVGLYDGETLAMDAKFGGMSHSFGNNAQVLGPGTFLTAELGDQRGIGVKRLSAAGYDVARPDRATKQSWTPYTYKARHSFQSKGAPLYPEMSKDGKKRYKRSNDNRCYTELAFNTFIPVDGGAASLMFFTGELPALDITSKPPRNLAFIKLNNDISKKEILSDGPGAEPEERGGFYNYWGTWVNQVVKGVHLLTRFHNRSTESASRPKALRLGPNRILCLFEVWKNDGKRYDRTMALIVDDAGSVVEPPRDLFYNLQLPYSDKLRLASSVGSEWRAVWYSGILDGRLARFELKPRSSEALVESRQTAATRRTTIEGDFSSSSGGGGGGDASSSSSSSTNTEPPACIPASAPPLKPCDNTKCSQPNQSLEKICRKTQCSGCSQCANMKFCESKCKESSGHRFASKPWSTKCKKWFCRDCEECLAA